MSMVIFTRLFSGWPLKSTVPENFSNAPAWLPVTFEPTNSIFELPGVIEYFSPGTAGEDETGAASVVTAFDLSDAGFPQDQTSESANRIVRIALERTIKRSSC